MTNVLKLLPSSKFLQNSLIYSLVIGINAGLRVSFVFLLGLFSGFDDFSKFFLYGALTISSDTLSIFGSYLSAKFLGKRLSCLLGFSLIIIGNCLLFFAFSLKNQILLYSTLVYISLGIGILKCNLFVIANTHLQNEFTQNKNDYGSILHTWSVLCSFLMIFLSGFLIKNHQILIPLISIITLSITFLFFILIERPYIILGIKKLNFSKSKNLKLISMLIFLNIALFIFFFFSSNIIIRNIPIFIFFGFVFYLLKRIVQNKDEKDYIFLALIFSSLLISYLSFERQRDTTLAFFLARNVELDILSIFFQNLTGKFVLTPIQLNSMFPIFILTFGFFLFKFKIHTKLKTKYSFFIINICLFFSFGILFCQTKLSLLNHQENLLLNPICYIFSMIFMSLANVLVYSKFIEVCRIMPPALNQIISSFMIVSVATGFYIARFFNNFMIVEKNLAGPNNPKEISSSSLEIYSNGFLKLTIISLIFLFFWIIFFSFKKIQKILEKE